MAEMLSGNLHRTLCGNCRIYGVSVEPRFAEQAREEFTFLHLVCLDAARAESLIRVQRWRPQIAEFKMSVVRRGTVTGYPAGADAGFRNR